MNIKPVTFDDAREHGDHRRSACFAVCSMQRRGGSFRDKNSITRNKNIIAQLRNCFVVKFNV